MLEAIIKAQILEKLRKFRYKPNLIIHKRNIIEFSYVCYILPNLIRKSLNSSQTIVTRKQMKGSFL